MHRICTCFILSLVFLMTSIVEPAFGNSDIRQRDKEHVVIKKCKSLSKQLVRENTIYEIYDVITIGKDVTIPKGCTIVFNGGRLQSKSSKGYCLIGNNTILRLGESQAIGGIKLEGSFLVDSIYVHNFYKYQSDYERLTQAFNLAKKSKVPTTVFFEPHHDYVIKQNNGNNGISGAIFRFSKLRRMRIEGQNARIIDVTASSSNMSATVFEFRDCDNVDIKDLCYLYYRYKDISLDKQIGYIGGRFLQIIGDCSNFNINVKATGALEAVKINGNIKDVDYRADRGLTNSAINVSAYYCGYPVTVYLADSLNITINSDIHHRACILHGLINSKVNVSCRNICIAPQHVLCRDMLYKDKNGRSIHKACSDLNVSVIDNGTTREPSQMSYCFGLGYYGLNTEKPDSFFNINVKATTKSPLIGLFCFTDAAAIRVPGKIKDIVLEGVNDGARMTSAHIDMFENLYGHDYNVSVRYIGKYLSRVSVESNKGKVMIHDSDLDYLYVYGKVDLISSTVVSHISHYRRKLEARSVNTEIRSINSRYQSSNVNRLDNEQFSIISR